MEQDTVVSGVVLVCDVSVCEPSMFGVSGHREPVCGLPPEAVGSTDEGREHRVDRVTCSGLRSDKLPRIQVHQKA